MIEHLLTRSCELVRRAVVDPLDPDAELGDLEPVESTVCELQRTVEGEAAGGRLMVNAWRLFLPADVRLTGWDAIRVDGVDGGLLELDGDAWPVRNPRTKTVSHVEAAVRRVG